MLELDGATVDKSLSDLRPTPSRDTWLTMSPIEYLNSTRWQTLGRGDTLGLRALYP